jgi:hypothetical protein
MSQSFPTTVPSYPDTGGTEVLGNMGAGRGLSRLLDDLNLDVAALATKLGTGANTPSAGKVLRSLSNGTSVWGAIDLTADISGLSAAMAAWLIDPTSAKLRAAVSDETGTGNLVFSQTPTLVSPTLTTPVIGSFVTAQHNHYDSASGGAVSSWHELEDSADTVTALGNGSYSVVFNGANHSGLLTKGMRARTTRTTGAPTQCTSLNGTTQYWVKTTPNKLTFTDDFVVSAWIKVTTYAAGIIASRYNGTSGWRFAVDANGRISLEGYNAGAANISYVQSYGAIPLNKWVHVTAQLDMSTFTATPTTSYVMFGGVDTPAIVGRSGTNPTALIQAGNLEIGSNNGGTNLFTGKIAQVAIFNAKVTQATILGYLSQTLAGTETSLASAYSFNNAVTDLNTTTPNNLSVGGGSAVATNADSPFGTQGDDTISSVYDYGKITKVTFSTNTTVIIQMAEGCTIPTAGGITTFDYSGETVPYNFPAKKEKWTIGCYVNILMDISLGSLNDWYIASGTRLGIPIGDWELSLQGEFCQASSVSGIRSGWVTAAATAPTAISASAPPRSALFYVRLFMQASVTLAINSGAKVTAPLSLSAATDYYLYGAVDAATGTETWQVRGDNLPVKFEATLAY